MSNNLDSIRDRIAWRIAKSTFVVVVKDGDAYNLIVDPGLGQPWHSQNRKHADVVASECDGAVFTFEDAFKLLLKHNGGEKSLEKHLMDKIKQAASVPNAKFFRSNTNEIVDQHGRPVAKPN